MRFGVEPICRVLSEHGCPIAPSTFYDALSRSPSRRASRNEALISLIASDPGVRLRDWPPLTIDRTCR